MIKTDMLKKILIGRILLKDINQELFIFPLPMPIKAKWFVIGYIILEIVQGWGVGDGIAHFAHVGGMLWGWALLYYWKNNRKIWF